MSTQTPTDWPTQLFLPGQAAAPEGPVDMQMMYVLHRAFRRDLDRFVVAARNTPVRDRETWHRLAARWQVFCAQLHHHHEGEDRALWPYLLEHGSDEDVATLEAMEAEHADIDPLLTTCTAGFDALAAHEDEDARSALAVRLVATRDHLARHLAHEEQEAITILQRVMTPQEWRRLDDEELKGDMSLSFVLTVVPWAAEGLPREVLDRVFAETGLPFKVVWLLTRRRWARREARAFSYA
jgi:hemerythrin-like domain-containing protein